MKPKNSKPKTKKSPLERGQNLPQGDSGVCPSPNPGPPSTQHSQLKTQPSPSGGWTIIHPKKPETLPKESGTYAVIYYQATKNGDQFTGRQIEHYSADKNQWHTGMRSVKILAWLHLPEIPEELNPTGTSDLAESPRDFGAARVAGTTTKVKSEKAEGKRTRQAEPACSDVPEGRRNEAERSEVEAPNSKLNTKNS